MKRTITQTALYLLLLWGLFFCSFIPALAQNETPSSRVARAVAPYRWEANRGENTFVAETGSPRGQHYFSFSIQQTRRPGLFPHVDLVDHMDAIDGTFSTGVLLHTGHGGSSKVIGMESFTHANDAMALAAANRRLAHYGTAAGGGYDIAGADRELGVAQQAQGHYVIVMYDRAVTNHADGLAKSKSLIYIATCYGSLMLPAYVGKGARVGVGNVGLCARALNRRKVERFFRRMNGREGIGKRPVSGARMGFAGFGASGNEATTLAPVVTNVTAPCPIKAGDKVIYTLDTKCHTGIRPDIIGTNCTIENETWKNETTLEGTCTAPPAPGAFNFKLTLDWRLVYSLRNTARLDGNTNPAGVNGRGPAHDNYVSDYSCARDSCSDTDAIYFANPDGCAKFLFEDASQSPNGPITNWQWDFGDGSLASGPFVPHQYQANGVYDVCLTIRDSVGCMDRYCEQVTVSCLPDTSCNAHFIVDDFASPIIFFNDQSTFTPTSNIVSWEWSFDDGTTDTVPDPMHTFQKNGQYSICLAITTSDGCRSESCQPVTINAHPIDCKALYDVDFSPDCPHVQFSDSSSADSGNVMSWFWDFGDGSTSTMQNPLHSFVQGRAYEVKLIITTSEGCQDSLVDQLLIECATDIDDAFSQQAEMTISPNPVRQSPAVISIELSEAVHDGELVICDFYGRPVLHIFKGSMKAGKQVFSPSLKNLSNGMYHLIFKGNEGIVRKKIVILH